MGVKLKAFFIFICILNPLIHTQGKARQEFNLVKENGIPVAINPSLPVPVKDSPRDIIFSEEFTLGAVEGDPDYVFGAFISFAVDEDEHVYVLDWRGKVVRKFDRNGKFLLSFGREGQGPGEFTYPEEIRFLPNGQIMVFEGESQKYSCFTQEGKFVRGGRFHKLMYSPYFGFSSGNYLATHVQRDENSTLFITGLFNEKSELITPLYQSERKPDLPWPDRSDQDARARRLAEAFSRGAFRRKTVIALNEKEDIYFAFTDKYEIKIYDAHAQLRKIIKTELPFLPVEREDRLDFLNIHLPRDISTWSTMDKTLQNKIKSLIKFPENKPAFLSIIPMDNEYLMIVRDGSLGRNALVDIFDPSGRFIIEKKLDFSLNAGICRKGRLYSLWEDEDGNQFIKCYAYKFQV